MKAVFFVSEMCQNISAHFPGQIPNSDDFLRFSGGVLSSSENEKNPANAGSSLFHFGGDEGSRTPDLLNAIQALSQLSYTPTFGVNVVLTNTSIP